MLYCFFVYWHLNEKPWLEDQDSGFRNRAIKHSLKTRQMILGYRGWLKMHKTIGTPPCTLRQPWVSVYVSCVMCHVSRVTCHMSHITWLIVNIVSKFQVPSSNGLGFMVLWIFGGKWSLTWSISQLITKVFVEQPRLQWVCKLFIFTYIQETCFDALC